MLAADHEPPARARRSECCRPLWSQASCRHRSRPVSATSSAIRGPARAAWRFLAPPQSSGRPVPQWHLVPSSQLALSAPADIASVTGVWIPCSILTSKVQSLRGSQAESHSLPYTFRETLRRRVRSHEDRRFGLVSRPPARSTPRICWEDEDVPRDEVPRRERGVFEFASQSALEDNENIDRTL